MYKQPTFEKSFKTILDEYLKKAPGRREKHNSLGYEHVEHIKDRLEIIDMASIFLLPDLAGMLDSFLDDVKS